jgi:metal-responsive CopG/Arc/MetJ family transcriptional regulator
MRSIQIAVRLPSELLQAVDDLIGEGISDTRAELVRRAIEMFVDGIERIRIDQAILEGYRRKPITRDEEASGLAALRQSIAEEPW